MRGQLKREAEEWADTYHAYYLADVRFGSIRTSIRCDAATITHRSLQYGPLFDVTTTGRMRCTLVVWGVTTQ